MRWLWSVFIFFIASAYSGEFFDQFDRLKSQDWPVVCDLGEKALQDDSLPNLEKAQIHARLASSYFYLGDYESMVRHVQECRSIALDLSSKQYLARALYLLSAYYRGNLLFEDARATISEAIELTESDIEDCLKAKVFFNAGAAHADDPFGDVFQAIYYYQKAINLFGEASDDAYRTQIRMAKCWLVLKNYREAWDRLSPLFQVDLKPRTHVHLQYISAQVNVAQGEWETALIRISHALEKAEKLQMKVDIERLIDLEVVVQNALKRVPLSRA